MLPDLKQIYNIDTKSASGNKLKILGLTKCTFSIGNHSYTYDFVVCKNISRRFILVIDILRQNLIDICWTPTSQKPYNLPLKHSDWVQKELDTLEKAGVITRSVSPWASPIATVPKKMEPG